jgi:hypothetical protein
VVALTDADDEERKETEECAGQKDGYGENHDVRVIALLAFPVAVIRVLADRDGSVLHGSEVTLCRVMAGSRVVRGFRSMRAAIWLISVRISSSAPRGGKPTGLPSTALTRLDGL